MTDRDTPDAPHPEGADPIRDARDEIDAAEVAPAAPRKTGEDAGDVIDRYKLLQRIGEGGMGTVWMADQSVPVRRKVALKIIKLGMDTREVIARFEAERQALALMDHPHIAKVFDGGATDNGRPYFVMELVRGVPITDYCDEAKLGLRERLELFAHVCNAVQHAHQKGVIHRDIKPSNILVTMHDGVPVPKVIDFGIAKATSAELTQRTLFTQYAQFIGTPEYMAPEQAEMSGLDIDTRADIYSLGVLLYELLTGVKPFDLKQALRRGFDEVLRTIREEEPVRPSTRISTLGETGSGIAAARHVNVAQLSTRLRGDLDAIIMKSLEKDRRRRYESASAFSEDIARYLRDAPVLASPPSNIYRVRKFVRRHRAAVSTALAIVMILVGGIITATWSFFHVRGVNRQLETALVEKDQLFRRAEDHAEQARAATRNAEFQLGRADEVIQVLRDMLTSVRADTARGADITLMKSLLDRVADRLDSNEIEDVSVRADLEAIVGSTYSAIAVGDRGVHHLRKSLELAVPLVPKESAELARIRLSLADAYLTLDRPADALREIEPWQSFWLETFGPKHRVTAMASVLDAAARCALAEFDGIEEKLIHAIEAIEEIDGPSGHFTLNTRYALARTYARVGRLDEAIAALNDLIEDANATLGDDNTLTLRCNHELAYALVTAQRPLEAERLIEDVVRGRERIQGPFAQDTLQSKLLLETILQALGKKQEAMELSRTIVETALENFPEDHPITIRARMNYGSDLFDAKRLQEARDQIEPIVLQTDHFENPGVECTCLSTLVQIYANQREFERVDALLDRLQPFIDEMRERHESASRMVPYSDTMLLKALTNVAYMFMRSDRAESALPLLETSFPIKLARMGHAHQWTYNAARELARCYDALGKPDLAIETWTHVFACVDALKKTEQLPEWMLRELVFMRLHPTHPQFRDVEEGLALAEAAVAQTERKSGPAFACLGEAYRMLGRLDEAIAVFEEALGVVEPFAAGMFRLQIDELKKQRDAAAKENTEAKEDAQETSGF